MSLTSFIVSRNWASSRLRILLTLVGVALGVAIVVAIYVMDFNTIQSRLVQQDPERGRVDLEVLPIAVEQDAASTRADLVGYDGVQDVATWREARGVAVGAAAPLPLSVYGLGPLPAAAFAHYVVNRGRDLDARDEGEHDPPAPASGERPLGFEEAKQLLAQRRLLRRRERCPAADPCRERCPAADPCRVVVVCEAAQ